MPGSKTPSTVEFEIPYGATGSMSIYINETLYDSIFNFKVYKYLNNIWIFEAIVPDTTKADSNILRGKTVKVFVDNTLFIKGTIEESDYGTHGYTKISGLGSAAYAMRKKRVGQNVENESYFDSKTSAYIIDHLASLNNDGASPWIVTTNHVDTFPSVFVRMDNEDKINGVIGICGNINYDWYESWGSFPFNDNVINVKQQKGSASSVLTFEVSGNSQNAVMTEREEDKDQLWNDIIVCGYGDGVNQLKSRIYHATTNRTYLTSATTKSGTETINVADTTTFPSSGNVWIGCEKIAYTGKTGTTLTGITRSVAFMDKTNVTDSYIHNEKIAVYDAQYTTTSAQYDSSIGDDSEDNDKNWGLHEETRVDKSIVDQNTLDLISQNLLDEHNTMPIRITIEPMDLYDVLPTVSVGDVVTINDVDAGSSAVEFRVVGFELGMEDAAEYLIVKCSNVYKNMAEVISKTEEETKQMAQFMQGATNIYAINEAENCDNSNYLNMRFYLPDEAIAVNSINLNFKLEDFRAYSSTTSGGSSHTHTINAVTSEYGWGAVSALLHTKTISSICVGTGTNIKSAWGYIRSGGGDFYDSISDISIYLNNSSNVSFNVEMWRVTSWSNNFDAWSGYKDSDTNYTAYAYDTSTYLTTGWLSIDLRSATVPVLARFEPLSSTTEYHATFCAETRMKHKHEILATTSAAEAAHTHGVSFAISNETLTSPSVNVYVGEDGGSMTLKGTYTTNQTDVDLSTLVKAVGVGKWINVQFRPNKRMRIESTLYAQIFIRSE